MKNRGSRRSRAARIVNRALNPFNLMLSRRKPALRITFDVVRDALNGRVNPYVIDIGAAGGNFAAEVRQIAPNAKLVCLEPIPSNCERLRQRFGDADARIIQAAAGDHDTEMLFHEAVSQDCSSILPMERHRIDFPDLSAETRSYNVLVCCLDTLLADDGGAKIDLLKIDTQGFELPVLRGAKKTLMRSAYVLMEVSLRPLYQGQPPFEEVVVFMYQHGFRMMDYVEGTRSRVTNELLQLDFLYQRVGQTK